MRHSVSRAKLQICYTCSSSEGCGSFREFGYLSSSARTRITSAVTNRQSMAVVITTRIQDNFSSMSSPPLRWHGPQVVLGGLRTDGPLFRADLSRHRSHTRKKNGHILTLDSPRRTARTDGPGRAREHL